MSEMTFVDILVKHVLLTSRNGFAACASEDCGWQDSFCRADKYDQVPLFIRVAHADHQLELLTAAGFGSVREAKAEGLEDAARTLDWVKPESACADTESCCGSEASCDAMRPSVVAVGPAWLRARAAAVRSEA